MEAWCVEEKLILLSCWSLFPGLAALSSASVLPAFCPQALLSRVGRRPADADPSSSAVARRCSAVPSGGRQPRPGGIRALRIRRSHAQIHVVPVNGGGSAGDRGRCQKRCEIAGPWPGVFTASPWLLSWFVVRRSTGRRGRNHRVMRLVAGFVVGAGAPHGRSVKSPSWSPPSKHLPTPISEVLVTFRKEVREGFGRIAPTGVRLLVLLPISAPISLGRQLHLSLLECRYILRPWCESSEERFTSPLDSLVGWKHLHAGLPRPSCCCRDPSSGYLFHRLCLLAYCRLASCHCCHKLGLVVVVSFDTPYHLGGACSGLARLAGVADCSIRQPVGSSSSLHHGSG